MSFSTIRFTRLRLREREQFSFRAPDIGQLFHDALHVIAHDLQQRGIDWASLSDEQCFEYADAFDSIFSTANAI